MTEREVGEMMVVQAMARRVARLALLALLAAGGSLPLSVRPASATSAVGPVCTVRWAGPADGQWDVGASWSTGSVPSPADDVCIDGADPHRVVLTGDASIHSLTLGSPTAAQTLAVLSGVAHAVLDLAAASAVEANGALELGTTGSLAAVQGAGHLTNHGTLRSLAGVSGFRAFGISSTTAVDGRVEIGGLTVFGDPGATIANDGTITVQAGGGLFVYYSTFISRPGSTLDLSHGGTATSIRSTFRQAGGDIVSGPVHIRDGSTLDDSAGGGSFLLEPSVIPNTLRGTIPAGQLVTVLGTAEDGDATAALAGPSVVNNGFLRMASTGEGRLVRLTGSPLTNNGSLVVMPGTGQRSLQTDVTNYGQLLIGATTFVGTGSSIVNRGLAGLEDGADLMFNSGSFTNDASGTLYTTVNATTSSVSRLGGTATASLGGTLEVRTIGSPAVGATFTPIIVDSRLGTFSNVTSASPSVTAYSATYSGNSVGLVVGPPRARFVPVGPVRILDTRTGIGASAGRRGAGGVVSLPVAGHGGVPATGASAVVLTVTGVDTSPGFVTVWPTGTARPTASNLNTTRAGQTAAVQVVVPVGSDGTVSLYTSGGGQLLADVAGWYETVARAASGRFRAVAPARLLDTRNGTGAAAGRRGAGATVAVAVAGLGGVPASGASSVVLSVTGVDSSAGFVAVWPGGQPRPTASNLNTDFAGQTTAAHVVVPLGADGSVNLFTSGGGHLLVDVVGWFTDGTAPEATGGLYVALSPLRRVDTRTGLGVGSAGVRAAHSTVGVLLGGSGGIPATGVTAVVANLTAVQAAPTFLTAWAGGAPRPLASNLNVTIAGDTVANLVTSPVGSGAFLDVYTDGASHLLLDTAGYYQS